MKRKLLVVGSGRETEPNYFGRLKREQIVGERFAVTVNRGPGRSPSQTVDHALKEKARGKRRKEAYDEIWCVLDVEEPANYPEIEKALQCATDNGVRVCLSNPSFEVWFLSHYERTARPYTNCDAVIEQLNKHWDKHHRRKYDKNDERVYDRLAGVTNKAIENAKWVREVHHDRHANTVDCNSSTEVYRLVEYLLNRPSSPPVPARDPSNQRRSPSKSVKTRKKRKSPA